MKETLSVFTSISILTARSTEPRATDRVFKTGSSSEEKADHPRGFQPAQFSSESPMTFQLTMTPNARIGSSQKETSGSINGEWCN